MKLWIVFGAALALSAFETPAPMQAQQPVREAVKGADPQRPARVPEQPLDAAAHLRGGLVGESDREDAVRRDALHLDEPSHAVHEHARLAAARAGEDQHRALCSFDGLALLRVELIEKRQCGSGSGIAQSILQGKREREE